MNTELWVAEISEQSPCGEDLEYDADFLALEQAGQRKPEQQYGDTIIPAEEPDWRAVERIATALLQRTKDIRVCVLLTRACTQNYGLAGLTAGLQTIHTLLARHWDAVYPRISNEGDSDPFVRINAVAGLADRSGLVRDIRQAILIRSTVGSILVKDAEAALDNSQSSDTGFRREQIIAICHDAHGAAQVGLTALTEAQQELTRIVQLCDERFGAQFSPPIGSLTELLSNLVKALIPNRAIPTETGATDSAHALVAGSQAREPHAENVLAVQSREDAIRVLEIVCRYIEKNEPTNPAPLLIKRAQRLMSLSFVEIIKDLAPDSMGQIALITGVSRD